MSDLLIEVDEMVMVNILSKNLDTNIIKPLTKLIVKERERTMGCLVPKVL